MMRRGISWLCVIGLLANGAACSTSEEEAVAAGSDIVEFEPDAGETDPDTGAPVEPHVYDDDTVPKVDLPTDPETWSELTPPLAQVGADTGEAGVMYSASLCGYFLIRMQQDDGSYKYEYKPDTGEFLWEDVIHRQVGPGYAAALLYEELKREEFRLSAEWVFQYGANRIVERGEDELRLTDIGATSILTFGLSRLVRTGGPGADAWVDTLRGLGNHLLALQREDGSFSEGSPLARGQAVQALSHLWLTFQEDQYLDALKKTAKFSCDTWEAEIEPDYLPYFILYANEALATLYAETNEDYLPECVFAMTQGNMDDQYTAADTDNQDWVGGFNKAGDWTPSWSASLKLEAIADALVVARLAGNTDRAAEYEAALRIGVPFVQRFQWRVGETDDWPTPETVIGGFPYLAPGVQSSLAWPLSRTDLAWHGTAFLVKAARVLGDEYWPNSPAPAE